MIELSKRLQTIASFVRPGSRIADVGTDHGFLPIYLIEQEIASHGIAMDVRKGPLSRAQEHIAEAGLEAEIETRLGNGLEKLIPGEADTVIIAGMGGPLMLDILRAGSHVSGDVERFVLSPQSDWRGFRLGLRELGLQIVREEMICEDGKYYVIMEAVHDVSTRVEEESELRFGRLLLEEKHPVLLEYLLWQTDILTGILEKLCDGEKPEAERRREQIRQELNFVEAALEQIRKR